MIEPFSNSWLKINEKMLKNSDEKMPDVFKLENFVKHVLISDSAGMQFDSYMPLSKCAAAIRNCLSLFPSKKILIRRL